MAQAVLVAEAEAAEVLAHDALDDLGREAMGRPARCSGGTRSPGCSDGGRGDPLARRLPSGRAPPPQGVRVRPSLVLLAALVLAPPASAQG